MSEVQTNQSFLNIGTEDSDVPAVESPELDFSAVKSPTVDSPALFEYEGPFGVGPRNQDLFFELFRKNKKDLRLQERNMTSDFYGNFEFNDDGSIKIKKSENTLDLDLDFDLKDFGIKIPEWNPQLNLSDIEIGDFKLPDGFDLINIDLKTPDGIKDFISGITSGLEDLIKDIDLGSLEDLAPSFDGYGSVGKNTYDALAQMKKFHDDPTVANAQSTLDRIDSLNSTVSEKFGTNFTVPEFLSTGLLNVGAVSSIADFVDDPTIKNAVLAYEGTNRILENYTDLGSLPGSKSDIAKFANKALIVVDVATSLDEFIKNPSVESGLLTSAAVSNAVVALTAEQTAANLTAASVASVLNPIVAVYTGVELIKMLTHDQDFSRSEGIVEYKDGKFVTTLVRGSDGGALGHSHWADAHTYAATETLNTLVDDYKFTVDEKAIATMFADKYGKGYITNSPSYAAQGNRNASYSAQGMVLSLLKSGALKPSEDTPLDIINSQESFSAFAGQMLLDTQNITASRLYDQQGFVSKDRGFKNRETPKYGYMAFGSKKAAQDYADKSNASFTGGSLKIGDQTGKFKKELNFTKNKYSVGFENHLEVKEQVFSVGNINRNVRTYEFGSFGTEAEAKAYIANNSGTVINKNVYEGMGKGRKLIGTSVRQDYAYTYSDGQYIIGRREVVV